MSSTKAQRPDLFATRTSLLRRLQDCEEQSSWREFYDVYGDLIFRFALQAGLTVSEAEEVVQETTIAIARNLPDFKYDPAVCSFKTWLLNQAKWRILDQLRRRAKQGNVACSGAAVPSPLDETRRTATLDRIADPADNLLESLWEKDWQQAIMERAVQHVKRRANLKEWQMFDLYVLRQTPAREVARTMKVSVGRVYLAKHRIGRLLKKETQRLEASEL